MARKRNFKRRPNNAGTVIKLSGKRRKPYCAKITIGKNEITGAQIQKPIGYFETRQEALDALSLYNLSNKNDIDQNILQNIGGSTYDQIIKHKNRDLPTFADIYEVILKKDLVNLSNSRQSAYNSAFKRLKMLHNKNISVINLFDMQEQLDLASTEVREKTLSDMKTICIKVFEYAVIHQYIDRNNDFTSYLTCKSNKQIESTQKHIPFTVDEIKILFEDNSIEAKCVLVYIFTGCRPVELLNVNHKNIFFNVISNDNGEEIKIDYIITGSKTAAGKNRIIPIHNIIKPFIQTALENLAKYKDANDFRQKLFSPLMDKLKMNHLPYDTRHTFATLAKLYNVDEFSRKRIMGHKSKDLTDDVYTHTINNKLYLEINKININI